MSIVAPPPQLASPRDRAARASRLGDALAGLAQDLAAARREVALLKRENAALRSELNSREATG